MGSAMSEIRQWLEGLGLGRYADAFAENDITLALLPDLTDDEVEMNGESFRLDQGRKRRKSPKTPAQPPNHG